MNKFRKIKLTQGKYTIVDADDYEWLSQYKWCAHKKGRGYFYAERRNKHKTDSIHRLVINVPKNMQVDHINGDTLDNRKENLRICSRWQNSRNRKKQKKPSSSKYKGVIWDGESRWRAKIVVNKRKINLGGYLTEEEAAIAYNVAAKKYHKKFAKLNEI